jgi:O-antigen/teichoic acid export membrane protein
MQKARFKYLSNFLSISFAQIISNLLTFVSFSLIARYLGVNNFGYFSYYLAITFIIVKVVDFGFAPIVFRELSNNPNDYNFFNTAFNVRFFSFLVILFISNLILYIYKFTISNILIFNFLLFSALISYKSLYLRELLDIPFKVHYKMHISSLLVLLENLILLLGVFIIIFFKLKVVEFSFLYLFVSIPSFFILFIILYKKFNYKYKLQINNSKELFYASLPVYFCVIAENFYQQIDLLLLKSYYSTYEVGIYSALIRLVYPFLFIATAYVHNIFPVLSKKRDDYNIEGIDILALSTKLLIIIAVFISAILFTKSYDIIKLVYGVKYVEGDLTLKVLSLGIIPLFLNFYLINFLIAKNQHKIINYYSIILLFSNLIINLIFLNFNSYIVSAFARLTTLFLGLIFLTFKMSKMEIKINFFSLNLFIYTSVLFGILFLLKSMHFIFFIPMYALIGILLLFPLKVINKNEIYFLKTLLKR